MNHKRIRYSTIALLALVVIVGVACAPITITTNAPAAPSTTTITTPVPLTGAEAIAAEMPFKFLLIHSVFSPDQENANAVTVTRDGQDLTFPSDGSTLTTSGGGSFNPTSKKADGSGKYAISNNAGTATAQGAWQVVSFVSWQQLPGGYPADLKVTDSTPPPGTVRSAGILTLKVKLENLGEGEMVVHSKFLNTPDLNDTLLEGITLAVANSKFMEPAHDATSKIDEGSRLYVPTSAGLPLSADSNTGDSNTGKKVTLCHKTGSDSNPGVTITVSQNAVDAHLAHGDSLGACPGNPGDKGKPADAGKPKP